MSKRIFTTLIILFSAIPFIMAQNMISGNVIRENKKPLKDVKVTIEGITDVETITDLLGNFDIEVPLKGKVLIFSYDGMQTQKIGIGKKSFISVIMIEGKDEVPKPEVKKVEKPKEVKESKPKEVKESKPKEVKESKPKEVKESKPKEVKEIKPKEVKESKPKEVKESKPKEVKESKPKEVKESKPKEVKESKPKEVKKSKPKEVKASKPKETKGSKTAIDSTNLK